MGRSGRKESEGSKKVATSMRNLYLKLRDSARKGGESPLEISPGCPFGAVLEERLKNMEQTIEELKGRINGLIFVLVGALALEIIVRLVA